MLVTILGNVFHSETGTKECKKEFVCAIQHQAWRPKLVCFSSMSSLVFGAYKSKGSFVHLTLTLGLHLC